MKQSISRFDIVLAGNRQSCWRRREDGGGLVRPRPGLPALALTVSLSLCLLYCPDGQAQMSEAQLTSKVKADRILPPATVVKVTRMGERLQVDLTDYPSAPEKTKKADALLVARALIHADPGNSSGIIVRFHDSADPGGYTDAMISNREIVAADAGLFDMEELMKQIEIVPIRSADSQSMRFTKYRSAAERELRKEDLRESDYFFRQAYAQSQKAADADSLFISGLVRIVKDYDDRDDPERCAAALKFVMRVASGNLRLPALPGLRELYAFLVRKDDYQKAQVVAEKMVSIGKNGDTTTPDYASDLERLADCQIRAGMTMPAEKELQEALLIKRNKLGEHHPSISPIMEALGDCYSKDGKKDRAYDYYKRAKFQLDYAMTSRNSKERIAFEVYQGTVRRLDKKMKSVSASD